MSQRDLYRYENDSDNDSDDDNDNDNEDLKSGWQVPRLTRYMPRYFPGCCRSADTALLLGRVMR